MPTSAPGNSRGRAVAGFSLLELMVVVALIALATGLMSLSLRDRAESQLEEEGVRLAALLESARAQSRIAGADVRWAPVVGGDGGFRFDGLPEAATAALPHRWLQDETQAQVIGAPALVLGPEPLLAAQRVELHLGAHAVTVATDGLGPFALLGPGAGPAP